MKKLTILTLIILLALTGSPQQKSDYNIPHFPWSIVTGDLDVDGDIDIAVGHTYKTSSDWGGISILNNLGNGNMQLDSIFIHGRQSDVLVENLNSNPIMEIIGGYYDTINYNSFFVIIKDLDYNDTIRIPLYTNRTINDKTIAYINNDNYKDIVFASNNGQFWGVLYNDGTGHFGTPEYHYVDDTHPTDLDCGDLNGDGRDDVLLCGNRTLIYYSDTAGFKPDSLPEISLGAEIVDFDGDGDNDIILFAPLGYVNTYFYIYENVNNESFELVTTDTLYNRVIEDIQAVDFDNDGLPDLACLSNDVFIFYNRGNNTLSEPKQIAVENYGGIYFHFHCNDLDGNGYNDIAITRKLTIGSPAPDLTILFNDGEGNFLDSPQTGLHTLSPEHPQLTAWPNPFTRQITFQIRNTVSHKAALHLHNLAGKRMATLTIQKQKGGQHTTITWNGHNTQNRTCAPGIYVASLVVDGEVRQTTKIIKIH